MHSLCLYRYTERQAQVQKSTFSQHRCHLYATMSPITQFRQEHSRVVMAMVHNDMAATCSTGCHCSVIRFCIDNKLPCRFRRWAADDRVPHQRNINALRSTAIRLNTRTVF